jgi:hypothetical protein
VIVAGVLLIMASPALMLLAIKLPLPWGQLSDVGQAYGAASAVMSGLALLGVAVSLVIQQRQNRMTEEQTVRQRHFDLVRLTLNDLKFLYSWGFEPEVDYDPALVGFGTLILTHWLMLWRIGHIDESTLRTNARAFFRGQVGRDHWRHGGDSWPANDGRDRRFVHILTEEYRRAVDDGPPSVVPPQHGQPEARIPGGLAPERRSPDHVNAVRLGSAIAAAALGGYLVGRRRRRRD